jgi:glutamate-1-semialdehyde 2,1-aminomutase
MLSEELTLTAAGPSPRELIPGGVNSGQRAVPGLEGLVIDASSGAGITNASGQVFTDYHAAFGPPVLGHNDPDVISAMMDAIRRTDNPGVGVTKEEVELAEHIVDLVPSIEQVLLTSTGSEATFHALRVARAATGRRHVVKFQGCYHGWHDAVSLNVISSPERIGHRDPISAGILPYVLESTLVLPFNDIEALQAAFDEHGDDIAAVIVEPIAHNVGALIGTDQFLGALRETCTKHGSVLIFDEVITGFRHHLGGYQAICGVTPDLTALGKALGNGAPIGAIGGRADLMELFSSRPGGPVFFAGTYNGHPAMAAAALATLRKLRSEPVHEHIYRLGERIRSGVREICAELGVPAVPTGFGSVFVTYFMEGGVPQRYDDLLSNDVALFTGYRRRLLDRGILELPLNLKRSHISYAHTDSDIDHYLEAFGPAVQAARRAAEGVSPAATSMGGVS